ncbi:BAG family molecular chaperone regulator 8, chloroplastic-like [Aristolochia californica]|uniref:BAG family molecular chaperone regulator 8, chloroplastic-like n=1 Tax=Aristolochia californica TaxID=171875 RepID=UPI0035DE1853
MASHHHHHCHHQHNIPPPPSCSYPCCSPCPPALPAHTPPSATDPLLQIIAAHLLQSHPPSHHFSQYIKTRQHLAPKEETSRHSKQTHDLLQSLVHRVTALEASLRQLSSSPPPHFSSAASPSCSLRDVAARVIQTHFRAFLARRSKTLRHLKQLASIKSCLAALKSSLSDKTHFKPDVLLRKATGFLSELETIQGGDSMIREGKKSIEAELVHFLEFVDGLSVRRRRVQSKPVKKVSFAEYANESRVFAHRQEQSEDEEEEIAKHCQLNSEQQRVFMEKLSKENESHTAYSEEELVHENEAQVELEGFHQISDEEKNAISSLRGGYSGLSAPVPVQMEPKANDLMKKKKIVRIVNS